MLALEQGWSAASLEPASMPTRVLILRLSYSIWFLALGAVVFKAANGLIEEIAAGRGGLEAWPLLLSEGCVVLFYLIIGGIMLLRPEPVRQAKGLGPALLALAGTYGTWLIPFLPHGPELTVLGVGSAALLLCGEVMIIYTLLTLGWSFSLIPQARALVTRGPYALIRHPLYLFEEIAIGGILLHYAWFAALPFLLLHGGVQLRRIKLEEEILMASLPDYAAYAKRTSRLIPGVW